MAGTPSLSPGSRWSAADIAGRAFGTARRGYDQHEVRAFLELLAAELEVAAQREQALREQLAAAEERARHPVLDESALSAALGQHSAAVLRSAHEEAARIAQQSEESAGAALREAQAHATEVQVHAESQAAERIAEAELEANALRQQAKEEAIAVLEAARTEGESLVERAREHGRAMLDQAQEARRRVLTDMAHRRRAMTQQIEQFRAARDEIAGSVVGVRRSLDRIVDDLGRAEDTARAAAAQVGQAPVAPATEEVLVDEAERAADEIGVPTGSVDDASPAPGADASPAVPASAATDADESGSLRVHDIATVVSQPHGAADPQVADPQAADPQAADPQAAGPQAAGPQAADQVAAGAHEAADAADEAADAADELAPVPVPDPAEAVGAPAPGTGMDATSEVEELFARLRAQQDAPPTDVAAGDTQEDGALDDGPEAGGVEVPEAATAGDADGMEGAEVELPGPDAAALAARDETLGPIVTAMARRLKRALQDDQNRLLDRLRQGTGEWHDDLLAGEVAQRGLYAKAAAIGVRDSVAAGSQFARSLVGGRQSKATVPDQATVDAITEELAATIVAKLRRRLEGADIPDAAERIGAAYREWRGERIERLTEDRAVEAFDAGVLAGAARSKALRWVWVRSAAGPGCADCEDNALADDVPPGGAFPTGHRYPPAHPGCRCLVVPTAS